MDTLLSKNGSVFFKEKRPWESPAHPSARTQRSARLRAESSFPLRRVKKPLLTRGIPAFLASAAILYSPLCRRLRRRELCAGKGAA